MPTVICLTPVKNESWILERFLKCASLWADRIIISDQGSDDGSRDIAADHKRVILVDNPPTGEFNEFQIRKPLIEEARRIPGPKVLIALDADEALTPNATHAREWKSALASAPGTVLRFRVANVRPDLVKYWSPADYRPYGLIDDGSDYTAEKIHALRVPVHEQGSVVDLTSVTVLHFQYTDWRRMQSKHRWYQCWERVNDPHRSPISIYRMYHHMDAIALEEIHPIPQWWIDDFERMGIDIRQVTRDPSYRWERKVLDYLAASGPEFFAKLDIWDVDWEHIAANYGYPQPTSFRDPRTFFDRLLHKWLEATQARAGSRLIRLADRLLRMMSRRVW
jgi:hypothetical protein